MFLRSAVRQKPTAGQWNEQAWGPTRLEFQFGILTNDKTLFPPCGVHSCLCTQADKFDIGGYHGDLDSDEDKAGAAK